MGVAKSDRFGVLRLGRRTMLRMMVLGMAGLMCLGTAGQARADDTQDSFWTQFTPSADTRLIFVSSSEGHDGNSGLTPAQPVATIEKGKELLRDGYPDWMLLKRGDVWETGLGFWSKGGRSVNEPMVVGAYGGDTARPQLRPPGSDRGLQGQGHGEIRYIAFVGLHFEPRSRQANETPGGITWLRRGGNILFEDLYVARFGDNFNLQSLGDVGQITNIRINGCVIVESWSRASHSQGVFANKIDGLIIENSVIASNGFLDGEVPPTLFNHNLYINNENKDVIIRNNVIANASSHGVQLRCGGQVEGNLFLNNPIAVLFGAGTTPNPGGVSGFVKNNIVVHGRGITGDLPRSFGLDLSNIRQADVTGNIFSVSEIGYNGNVITAGDTRSHGIANLTIARNFIVNWHGSVVFQEPGVDQVFANVDFSDNLLWQNLAGSNGNGNLDKSLVSVFSSNLPSLSVNRNTYRYFGMHNRPFMADGEYHTVQQWRLGIEPDGNFESTDMPPPDLSITNYMVSLGKSGGVQEFIAEARLQSRQQVDESFRPAAVYSWARGMID